MGIQSLFDMNSETFDYSILERECKHLKGMDREQMSQATIDKQIPTENSEKTIDIDNKKNISKELYEIKKDIGSIDRGVI